MPNPSKPISCKAPSQPSHSMNTCAAGTIKNWPALPAAVPIPSAQPCFSAGTARAIAGNTMPNEVPAIPAPIITPAVRLALRAVVLDAIPSVPKPYKTIPPSKTLVVPKRLTKPPAITALMPHDKFCIASASAKTSRPQPLASLIGCKNRPKPDRRPNESISSRQALIRTGM